MNIILINPPRFDGLPVIREERCEITERYSVLEPYSLLQLTAILREAGHRVNLIDANGFDLSYRDMETKLRGFEADVLIFRFTPTTFDHDLNTCRIAKKINRKIKTIGLCWTLISVAEEVMASAPELDFYVTGDYEISVPALVEDVSNNGNVSTGGVVYRKGKDIRHNPASKDDLVDLDKLPIPAYDLLPSLDPYFINTPTDETFTIMYTSRGCPFRCIYCTVAGTSWKPRSADSVVKELIYLKENYDIGLVSFFDETFTIDRERVMKICDGIVSNNIDIKWYCNTRANLVDDELVCSMKMAGCRGISLGIESGSQLILDNASKGIKIAEAKAAIKTVKKHGIKVLCSFIIGLPGETWATVQETIDFVKETLPTGVQFNVAVPYPGTELYESARAKGLLKNVDWRHLYQHEAILGTDELSPDDLNKARFMAYQALYTYPVWYLENVKHILRNPEDFNMGVKYSIKIINNFLLHRMEHSH